MLKLLKWLACFLFSFMSLLFPFWFFYNCCTRYLIKMFINRSQYVAFEIVNIRSPKTRSWPLTATDEIAVLKKVGEIEAGWLKIFPSVESILKCRIKSIVNIQNFLVIGDWRCTSLCSYNLWILKVVWKEAVVH